MLFDSSDTIAAVASPQGGSARGVIRLSGPEAVAVAERLTHRSLSDCRRAVRLHSQQVAVSFHGQTSQVPCDVYLWPGSWSYTQQPSVELHTLGSPPLLEALLRATCQAGARLAKQGEFTLRAFAAGRIDLVQAEAVLGVIDAQGEASLQAALKQLSGGLSLPLGQLRESLIHLLAELEAGLDFVDEEDVTFLEPEELQSRLTEAVQAVRKLIGQTTVRGESRSLPRVVLMGEPNAGKSSLFNALRSRAESSTAGVQPAIVSEQAGTTRDSLTAPLEVEGIQFELVDTAGRESTTPEEVSIEASADRQANEATEQADIRLLCIPVGESAEGDNGGQASNTLPVRTKSDALGSTRAVTKGQSDIITSSKNGEGIEQLLQAIRGHLNELSGDRLSASSRCLESLQGAQEALERALETTLSGADDLVALELRVALDHLGDVVGVTVTDDILDRIFGQFCIGK